MHLHEPPTLPAQQCKSPHATVVSHLPRPPPLRKFRMRDRYLTNASQQHRAPANPSPHLHVTTKPQPKLKKRLRAVERCVRTAATTLGREHSHPRGAKGHNAHCSSMSPPPHGQPQACVRPRTRLWRLMMPSADCPGLGLWDCAGLPSPHVSAPGWRTGCRSSGGYSLIRSYQRWHDCKGSHLPQLQVLVSGLTGLQRKRSDRTLAAGVAAIGACRRVFQCTAYGPHSHAGAAATGA